MSSKRTRTRGEDYVAPPPVPKIKRTRGRPSDYEPALIDEACRLIRLGLTDSEICKELDVSVPTYYRWRANYPEFRNATNEAKDAQDDRVVDSLIRVAHEGNVTAQIFWLKNRRPAEWRDRRETELIVPAQEVDPNVDTDDRQLALAMLAMLNEAAYTEDEPAGPLLEMTANTEETDDGEADSAGNSWGDDAQAEAGSAFDPDFDF